MTFITVYKGTAINIPRAPAIKPAKIIIINISKGWDLTLFENMYGCEIKLSINLSDIFFLYSLPYYNENIKP